MTTVQDIQRQIYEAEQRREKAIRHENTRLKIQSEYQREIEAQNAEIAQLREQARDARLNESLAEWREMVRQCEQDNAALEAAVNEIADKLSDLFGPLNAARRSFDRCQEFLNSEAALYGSGFQTNPDDPTPFKHNAGRAASQFLQAGTPIAPFAVLHSLVAQAQDGRERAYRQAAAYVLLNGLPDPATEFSATQASANHLLSEWRQARPFG